MASLSSFINSSQYVKENSTFPFIAGMILGSTYNPPVFNGASNAASNDPGGLFGWLTYARSNTAYFNPARGSTSSQYIVYNSPADLVGDLNVLDGVTYCLISGVSAGGTYGFFSYEGTVLNARNIGSQFLYAINYMAYGGTLVIAGTTGGLNKYTDDTNNLFDVVIDKDHDANLAKWLITKTYTTGIFPTIYESGGYTGNGYTMANFDSLLGSSSLTSGNTVANRIFNICGVKTITNLDTSTVQANTKLTYNISAAPDVGGFFVRTKNRNELYLSIAGIDRSTILNGNITNPISWSSDLKTTLRNNRVNFFVNNNPKFLGSDLVGATASTAAITVGDRIGPSKLKSELTNILSQIALKYLFEVNNQTTRDQIVTEVQTSIDKFAPYLDTTKTQIICDNSNNQNNSSTLAIKLVVQPILSVESFVIDVSYTQ